ncbi:MAG: YdcF family protein, partial [Pseudomonadota bacterium]
TKGAMHAKIMTEQPTNNTNDRYQRYGRLAFAICAMTFAGVIFGFVLFVAQVRSFQVPDASVEADGIVVLTGGVARLGAAAELLREGRGGKLLISGVNENTSAETVKSLLSIDDAIFDCCVDLDRDALDTIGNARAALQWALQNEFRTILWVTNDYHMQRSLLEISRIDDGTLSITPYPVSNTSGPTNSWVAFMDRYRVLAGEYAKYLVALVRTRQVSRGLDTLFQS